MNQIAHLNTGLNLSLTSFEEYFKDGNPCFCVSYVYIYIYILYTFTTYNI